MLQKTLIIADLRHRAALMAHLSLKASADGNAELACWAEGRAAAVSAVLHDILCGVYDASVTKEDS